MRARKVILLFCSDEIRRSVLSFTLRTHDYLVIGGISAEPPTPDVILIVDDCSLATVITGNSIAWRLPDVAMLAIPAPRYQRLSHGFPRQAEMLPPNWRPGDVLERVRVLAARKRGPKKVIKHSAGSGRIPIAVAF